MKKKLAKAVKTALIKMAANDKLPLDMNKLDIEKIEAALSPVDDLIEALDDMVSNADCDCPSEYRTEHFRTAMDNANELLNQ